MFRAFAKIVHMFDILTGKIANGKLSVRKLLTSSMFSILEKTEPGLVRLALPTLREEAE